MKRTLLILATLLLVCCRTVYVDREVTKTVEVHHRDTTVVTETDSASLFALLACDSTNQVYIDYIDYQDGRITSLNAQLKDGKLKVNSDVRPDTITITVHDTTTVIVEKESKTIEVEKKGFLYNSGIALWVIIGLLLAGIVVGLVIKFSK